MVQREEGCLEERGDQDPGSCELCDPTAALAFGTSMVAALTGSDRIMLGKQGAGPVMALSPLCVLRQCRVLNPGIAVPA